MLCHSQAETLQNIFHLLMKELVVEGHEGELSLLLRSVCSVESQFGTIEEHFAVKYFKINQQQVPRTGSAFTQQMLILLNL